MLYTQMKPLLSIGRQEDEIKKKLEELEKLKEMLAKTEKTKKELEEQNVGLLQTKNDLFFQLQVCNFKFLAHFLHSLHRRYPFLCCIVAQLCYVFYFDKNTNIFLSSNIFVRLVKV